VTVGRVTASGKFLTRGRERFLIKGVAYGTFAPNAEGYQFPPQDIVASDFSMMAQAGLNTVRLYTPPPPWLLDEAVQHGLHVMLGVNWPSHVAFLDHVEHSRQIRRDVAAQVRACAAHPGLLMVVVGNEIPGGIVRWHGRRAVERFLRELYDAAKNEAPDTLVTYVNYPPTEFLDLSFTDLLAFNVYLHREPELASYIRRLQNLAGSKPLLLAEQGADSLRQGAYDQAASTAMQVRTAFREGACGTVIFAWTDQWWRNGVQIDDWAFGLVDAERRPKPVLLEVTDILAQAPFSATERRSWPTVSVVVCAYNAARTIDECLTAIENLNYPASEIIVVNDGSRDATAAMARRHAGVRVVDIANGGLANARNIGLAESRAEIVAYVDADTRVDPYWLMFLVQPFVSRDVAAAGGPNLVPPEDPWFAQCVARAPGAPTHVLIDDCIAEHVPGCNMAFRREALAAMGGFDPRFVRAGDDVDMCWRMQAQGWKIGFSAAALVWHHCRASIGAYWRQQVGYGEGEQWLVNPHPDKFVAGRAWWRGHIYGPLPYQRERANGKMNTGTWGRRLFPPCITLRPASWHLCRTASDGSWRRFSCSPKACSS
jgi:GT2 family glycosyltransferase